MELLDAQIKAQNTILENFSQSELEMDPARRTGHADPGPACAAGRRSGTTRDGHGGIRGDGQRCNRSRAKASKGARGASEESLFQMLDALKAVRQQAEEQVRRDRDGSRTPRRRSAESDGPGDTKPEGTAATPFKLGHVQPPSDGADKAKPPFPKAHT